MSGFKTKGENVQAILNEMKDIYTYLSFRFIDLFVFST